MNWLLYIGGGLLFNLVMSYILMFIISLPIRNFKNTKVHGTITIHLLWYIPINMIWVWLMWRYL